MKICTKCKIEKDLDKFPGDKGAKGGIHPWCKECQREAHRIYRKKYPWKATFQDIKKRCNKSNCKSYKDYGERGIKCQITTEELEFLWHKDGASEMKHPSIDRINNDGDYTLENCRYIEFGQNSAERNVRVSSKTVYQYDLEGNFIRSWKSTMEIQRQLGFVNPSISACCLEKSKQAYGYIWKYEEGSYV